MSNFLAFYKSKKYYVLIIIIIILFFLLRIILLRPTNTELTYTVKQEDLVDIVQVSGTYATASQVQVTSPTNGIVDKLFVFNNEKIKKGDPIFHVQSTATVDQQKTAYATYLADSSILQADNASLYTLQSAMFTAWNTYYTLSTNSTYQNGDGSPNTTNRILPAFTTVQDNWLASEANYKNQQAVLAKDQAAFSAAQQAYNETQSVTVSAPIDGTVVNLLTQPGDQVSANVSSVTVLGSSTGQAEISSSIPKPILVIANLSNPYITADISENYATRIISGQKASIVFDSLPNETFPARVESVDTVGTDLQGIVTYSARIIAQDIPVTVKPGMTAVITIETLRKDNVIDVPNSAIVRQNGNTYVEDANTRKLNLVMTGIKGVTKTQVLRGLSVGATIDANPSVN